jgi:hypothetical protein
MDPESKRAAAFAHIAGKAATIDAIVPEKKSVAGLVRLYHCIRKPAVLSDIRRIGLRSRARLGALNRLYDFFQFGEILHLLSSLFIYKNQQFLGPEKLHSIIY